MIFLTGMLSTTSEDWCHPFTMRSVRPCNGRGSSHKRLNLTAIGRGKNERKL